MKICDVVIPPSDCSSPSKQLKTFFRWPRARMLMVEEGKAQTCVLLPPKYLMCGSVLSLPTHMGEEQPSFRKPFWCHPFEKTGSHHRSKNHMKEYMTRCCPGVSPIIPEETCPSL